MNEIELAAANLGPNALTEDNLRRCVDPLFSRVLRDNREIYLANHSLGRPLDRTEADLKAAIDVWYADPGGVWTVWLDELRAFRSRVAALIGAPSADCVVPKASAGQGLRAVLNRNDRCVKVVATRGEFDSIDFVLKTYRARERIEIAWVSSRDGRYVLEDFERALAPGVDLLVVSLVFFETGQLLVELPEIIATAHARGAEVLVDLYHAAGALPVDVGALDADFAIGGCYKYLRGGPGAAWLYAHPRCLGKKPLDVGWFAAADRFSFERTEQPQLAKGGDGWLEATPAVLPLFQARAGLQFALAIGADRLRTYSLKQTSLVLGLLAERGVEARGADDSHGAFVTISAQDARGLAGALRKQGVVADARANALRLCPDLLNSADELRDAADKLARVMRAA